MMKCLPLLLHFGVKWHFCCCKYPFIVQFGFGNVVGMRSQEISFCLIFNGVPGSCLMFLTFFFLGIFLRVNGGNI